MSLHEIVCFIVGIIIGVYCCYVLTRNNAKQTVPTSVEMLKNALLTFCLVKCRYADFDNTNRKYSSFNGSKLPMLSGYSLENACFSYIINREDMKKDPFYTKTMEDKVVAIEKYLAEKVGTYDLSMDLFSEFIEKYHKEPRSDTASKN